MPFILGETKVKLLSRFIMCLSSRLAYHRQFLRPQLKIKSLSKHTMYRRLSGITKLTRGRRAWTMVQPFFGNIRFLAAGKGKNWDWA